MAISTIYGKQQILPGKTRMVDLGDLILDIKRENEGWSFLTYEKDAPDEITQNPERDYYQTGKSNSLIIQPAMPEKPLVFKGSRMFVSPQQKLTFFLKIPLTIQIYFSKAEPENLMKEITIKRLSDTWFGEADNGEIAFALGNEFALSMADISPSDFEAICPVTIFNNSYAPLEVERLIIRVENVTLYQHAGKATTSLVTIEYRGKEVVSSVDYRYSKIYNGEKAEVMTTPRNNSGKHMLKINFHFIKNIYKTE